MMLTVDKVQNEFSQYFKEKCLGPDFGLVLALGSWSQPAWDNIFGIRLYDGIWMFDIQIQFSA